MNGLIEFLSIDNVFFVLWGYGMSYIEFAGTVLNLLCVYLASRAKVWNWPVGIVGSVLYIILFYQIQLYSDLFEQIYFVITGFYGWWAWSNMKKAGGKYRIGYGSVRENVYWLLLILAGSLALGMFMKNIHIYLPQYFSEPASFPYMDAFTTVMSFAATILMAQKRIECWYMWVLVDIIGIGLYFAKDVRFISFEYVIFLVLATQGLMDWRKRFKQADVKI